MSGRRLILLYHRVAELERDPYRLAVRPDAFAAQLEALRARLEVVPLASLLRPASHDRAAITFDDGYADVAGSAREILESAGLPATVFVVAGAVDREGEFWWDRLERLVFEALAGHESLDVALDGRRLYVDTRSPAGRGRAHRTLYVRLRELPLGAIERFLDELAAEGDDPGPREAYRALGRGELAALAAAPAIEVGAHSLSHPRLSRIVPDEQRAEIAGSRRRLEELTGVTVTSFSYPHGDVDATVARIVEEAGYALACSSRPGSVSAGDSQFELPRRSVFDWDRDTFAGLLDEWLAG
ncbi:MAG TPA: polysaccharide deacetylase family protein [Gaiellaceae bacterium]|nr:polysaccharide deacetylase family protein [Gaiellaceae bacterium]